MLPAEIVAAMQEGHYANAREGLERLETKNPKPGEKAYYGLVRGISFRLEGHGNEARAALRTALADDPGGPWTAKLRFELATVELAAGRFADAEELARAMGASLLAADRKDRLAEVYRTFARRLLEPGDPIVKPDPNAAYELLVPARALARSDALRARLLLSMGTRQRGGG